ncbi:MAG: dephospho-CoA kinase, partial [Sedimentisphaerales bacterium]|nr:dephospho-CoA kinase [Sedimentisphaerales bacterium]
TEGLAKDDSGAATGGPTGNDTGTGTGSDAGGLAKGDSGNRAAAKAKGTLNRRAVAEIVFSNPAELERLTRLVHPLIAEREKQLVARYRGDSGIAAIVLDVPLLYESGQDRWCDKVIFVDCPESLRRERLRKSRGWEAETTKKIDALQWNTQLKAQRADYVIRNHSSLTELANQVETILARIRQEFA